MCIFFLKSLGFVVPVNNVTMCCCGCNFQVLKLDPTHVGAASVEALCAEAALPTVGDPSVAYEAYKRAVDMHPWSVSEVLCFFGK